MFFSCFFFSVERKICYGLEKAWRLSALLMLISACFEFDSYFEVIYCNFCSFWVSFFIDGDLWHLYAWKIFVFISAFFFCLIEFFSLKNLFYGNVFLN